MFIFAGELIENGVDRVFERSEIGEGAVGQRLLLHELPDPLNQVQVRRIRGQIDEINLSISGESSYQFGVLITGVIAHDADRTSRMSLAEFPQQAAEGVLIHRAIGGFAEEFPRLGIQGSEDAIPLPPRPGGHDPTEEAPKISQECSANEVGRIDEKDSSLVRNSLME